ncbi:unnamed protein product [Parnassius apollo]|uniref:(apollo) hypothetical protein n=1 Tax=Parnassius apollo TaxID=110799 RepID=A0A8S3WCS5_PARAO|nr:unnamed protein product [Parnassius apollo]
MFSCTRCGNKVSDGPLCNLCKRQFDFACAGITETNFRKLGERRSTWRCIDCKNAQSPASTFCNNPGIAVRLEEMQATLVNITQQLVPLASLIEDVKTIKLNKALLKKAKDLAKIKNFKYVWIKHCKILARKSDTSPTFRIKSEKDLLKFS